MAFFSNLVEERMVGAIKGDEKEHAELEEPVAVHTLCPAANKGVQWDHVSSRYRHGSPQPLQSSLKTIKLDRSERTGFTNRNGNSTPRNGMFEGRTEKTMPGKFGCRIKKETKGQELLKPVLERMPSVAKAWLKGTELALQQRPQIELLFHSDMDFLQHQNYSIRVLRSQGMVRNE